VVGITLLRNGAVAAGWGGIVAGTLTGLILIVLCYGIWNLRNWARVGTIAFLVLNILVTVIVALNGESPATLGIGALFQAYVVQWLLFNRSSFD
jgi:hypothetical protein